MPQPLVDGVALERFGKRAQRRKREFLAMEGKRLGEPLLLGAQNFRRPPEALPDIAAKLPREHR